MPRNLVLFSDGTGNSSAKLFKTNVWRVYQAVDLADPENPKHPRQFAFYDDGVGTSSFKPLAVLGGAFGVGLSRNVVDLYVFLCRLYQPGDRIYAFGFSRGAFTIRVLIGLVMSQGLLRCHGSEADLARLALDAYRAYRAQRFTSGNPVVGWLRSLRDVGLRALNTVLRRPSYAEAERIGRPGSPDAVEIQFVGLWDTVDAYGLPVDELTRAIDRFIWPLTMRDCNLNERVLRARHALAIDDERNAFHPRLWNEKPDAGDPRIGVAGGNLTTRCIDEERISQVWFAGVHSNVGGGYPDDGLSYVPLQWIMREAEKYGLRFESAIWNEQRALSDENGPLYDSRRGVAGYYRYNPRRIERLVNTPQVTVERTKVHESVLRRIQVGHDGYAPITLPPGFAVMQIDGKVVDGDAYLRKMHRSDGAESVGTAGLGSNQSLIGAGSPYDVGREFVYNWVWRRRVAYFATLAVTLVLAAMPLFAPGTQACEGRWCFLTSPIKALSLILPSFVETWTDSFSSHPGIFVSLLGALILCLRWGSGLERRVRDEMRRVWYALPMLKPSSPAAVLPSAVPSGLEQFIQSLRNHRAYRAAFRLLTHGLLPAGFLLSLGYGALALTSQLVFAYQGSGGAVCPDDGVAVPNTVSAGGAALLDLRSRCASTGVQVTKDATYRVRITVPDTLRWRDASIPAGPNGFECRLAPMTALTMAAAVPLRRHWTEPWFQPMARIGTTGNDTYALRGSPQTPPLQDRCGEAPRKIEPAKGCDATALQDGKPAEVFESTIVARSSGPLFLYVNDAVGWPLLDRYFYDNNRGCGRVEVAQIPPESPPGAP